MKNLWPCLASLTYLLTTACTDDETSSNDSTRDASATTTNGSTSNTATTTRPSGSSGPSHTTNVSAADAGLLDAAPSDGAAPDSGTHFDSGIDGGASIADASVDAGADASFGDAQVYIPDGGVVLRPTELPFDVERVDDLSVPDGFSIDVFANPGGQTRMLAVYGGAIYVTRPEQGDVMRLADTDADGIADTTVSAVSGYDTVHGITFFNDTVYLGTPKQLIRGGVGEDGTFTDLEILIDDLPDGGQHPLRTLGVGPDGLLYISVGSSCDACAEDNLEHATLLQVALDGSNRTVFASGLRNTIGFGWHPDTNQLWGMDNGSDWRGDELPPEELNHIELGGDYGWPYCYAKQVVDPIIVDPPNTTKTEYCAASVGSVFENQAHEAPIGMVFYDGAAFPEEYQGNAFVAMHGSWNRIPATGYQVVRVVFENGEPTGIETFVDGFLDPAGLATFGRPAGLAIDAEGALLFSDDSNGVIYRVTRD